MCVMDHRPRSQLKCEICLAANLNRHQVMKSDTYHHRLRLNYSPRATRRHEGCRTALKSLSNLFWFAEVMITSAGTSLYESSRKSMASATLELLMRKLQLLWYWKASFREEHAAATWWSVVECSRERRGDARVASMKQLRTRAGVCRCFLVLIT
jgi:hypothetical protein